MLNENKRLIQKNKTKESILEAAEELFVRKGYLNVTTRDITNALSLAKGTLFAHFRSKEDLFFHIFVSKIRKIVLNIETEESENNLTLLVSKYLLTISTEEDFLGSVYKEITLFPAQLKSQILGMETVVRNSFYSAIHHGILNGTYQEVNIADVLNVFFASIEYYLRYKENFTNESIIKQKEKQLSELIFILLPKKEE